MITGITGKIYPEAAMISHEVVDRLQEFGWECMEVYYQLQLLFTVEEDWSVPGIYIVGRINTDLSEIGGMIEPKLKSGTFDDAWNGLLKSGLVEVTDEGIALPLLAGKLAALNELQKKIGWQRSQLEKEESVQDSSLREINTLSIAVVELKRAIEKNLGVAGDDQ